MLLQDNARVFRCTNGVEEFVYLDGRGYELLFSPDGETYFTLTTCGFAGSTDKHHLSFADKHHGVSGELTLEDHLVTCNGVEYLEVPAVIGRDIFVVPQPANLVTEYLLVDEFGIYYYVDRPEFDWDYDSFRLFIGDGSSMREVKISRPVQRYRDGGTTIISTEEGTLTSPSPFKSDVVVTWKTSGTTLELTKLNPDQFKVTRLFGGGAAIFGGVTIEDRALTS